MSAVVLASGTPQAHAAGKYAGIVIDAKTGKTLYESSANSYRYPASLTKMMTIYLTFEALQSGKINKQTRFAMTANGAAEQPTKLGLKAGQTLTIDDAILALVTKSANDVATALGEFLGGSEARFADMMTVKAHALGMSKTVFKNANGLPNSSQHTTAHDMALLGIALREHFPQYYDYFSTRTFTYGKRRYGNHNHLLGRVKGMDGIKTGYTRASGFNLVSSVETGGRSIVAVVMGGNTAKSRDAQMVNLINTYLPKASRGADRDLIAKGPTTVVVASALALPKTGAPTPELRPSGEDTASEENAPIVAYAATEQNEATSVVAKAVTVVPPTRPSDGLDMVQTSATRAEPASANLPTGWVIQVASLPTANEASKVLSRTSAKAGSVLASAEPFTENFTKGGQMYYRARFGGFPSKQAAWNACGKLKKMDIACYAVQR